MSSQELFNLILNWPHQSEEAGTYGLDEVLDFVSDHVGDKQLSRFQDIASILTWLNGEHSNSMMIGQYHVNTSDGQKYNGITQSQVLRPGTKITIQPTMNANSMKFNDMESVQAYLNKGPASQSNDDSDEVDVTTDFSPPWNQYRPISIAPIEVPPKSRKNTKLHRVLTEKQPTACQTNIEHLPKRNQSKSTDKGLVEPMYKCTRCDKKYKQKSSLHRHEKTHVAKGPANVDEKKPHNSTKRSTKKKITIIPLNTAEPIST